MLFGSFLGAAKVKNFVPSPDKYRIVSQPSKVSGRMFARLPTELDMIKKNLTPGPGTYNPKGCNLASSGSFILSQLKYTITIN